MAREVLPSVPRALEAICAKAMARGRSERYPSALDLAADVERWLADQEVSVYGDPWSTKLLRWMRRHRAWTVSIVGSMLMVTLIAIFAAIIIDAARRGEAAAVARTEIALQAEQEAKQEALRRFRQSQQTVDTMLTGVSDVLQFYPGAKGVRSRLLEEAARSYAAFAAEGSHDPALQLESARAYVRLGDVRALLGEHAAARNAYQAALKAFQALADNAVAADTALERATCFIKLGQIETDIRATATAGEDFDRAEALLASLPQSTAVQHARATVLLYRGQMLMSTQPQQAHDQLLVAEKTLAELADSATGSDDNEHRQHLASLALCRSLLGQSHSGRGETAAAEEMLGLATSAFRELVRLDPDYPPYVDGLAFSEIAWANALRPTPRYAEQAQVLERAIADFNALNEILPARAALPRESGDRATNLAWLQHARGENAAAKTLLYGANLELLELYQSPAQLPRQLEAMVAATVVQAQVKGDLDQNEQAEQDLTMAVGAYETRLLPADPTSERYERGLGAAHRHRARTSGTSSTS